MATTNFVRSWRDGDRVFVDVNGATIEAISLKYEERVATLRFRATMAALEGHRNDEQQRLTVTRASIASGAAGEKSVTSRSPHHADRLPSIGTGSRGVLALVLTGLFLSAPIYVAFRNAKADQPSNIDGAQAEAPKPDQGLTFDHSAFAPANPPQTARIFRCVEDGKTTYSDTACATGGTLLEVPDNR